MLDFAERRTPTLLPENVHSVCIYGRSTLHWQWRSCLKSDMAKNQKTENKMPLQMLHMPTKFENIFHGIKQCLLIYIHYIR